MKVLKEKYHLSVKEDGAYRLGVAGKVYDPSSRSFLRAALKPGIKVLEVACGTGELAIWMARKVDSKGHVLAIDLSKEQVERTKLSCKKSLIRNVSTDVRSCYELDDLKNQFDLVHCRHLLIHLQDPLLALKGMYNCLKVGGKLICEEYILSHGFCHPASEAFKKRGYLVQKLYSSSRLANKMREMQEI